MKRLSCGSIFVAMLSLGVVVGLLAGAVTFVYCLWHGMAAPQTVRLVMGFAFFAAALCPLPALLWLIVLDYRQYEWEVKQQKSKENPEENKS